MRSALSLLCLMVFGCSSDRDAVEKRLASLREDITRMQSENDRLSERVDALEVKQVPAATPAPASAEPRVERPALKVVKVLPEDGESPSSSAAAEPGPEERPDAPGSRPMIRVRGKELKTAETGTRPLSAAEER